jgi:hypothetical protein
MYLPLTKPQSSRQHFPPCKNLNGSLSIYPDSAAVQSSFQCPLINFFEEPLAHVICNFIDSSDDFFERLIYRFASICGYSFCSLLHGNCGFFQRDGNKCDHQFSSLGVIDSDFSIEPSDCETITFRIKCQSVYFSFKTR